MDDKKWHRPIDVLLVEDSKADIKTYIIIFNRLLINHFIIKPVFLGKWLIII